MALIKTTAIVDSISGSIQGTVFANNKGGAYMRGRGLVTNPQTQAQAAVRTLFAGISQRWRDLTNTQREAWIAATVNYPYQNRLGDTSELTGKALFQKLNQHAATPLDLPPLPQGAPGISTPAAVDDGISYSTMLLQLAIKKQLSSVTPASDGVVQISVSAPQSPGVMRKSNGLRVIGTVPFSAGAPVAVDFEVDTITNNAGTTQLLGPAYVDLYGVPPDGANIFFKLLSINTETGETGAPLFFRLSTVYVAA